MPADAPVTNPAGAFGLAARGGQTVENVLCANSISAGELVALSTSPGYVIRNLVATGAGLQCGVALETGVAGDAIAICTGGWVLVNKGTAALTAGDLAKADPTVSGAVGAVTAATVVSQASNVRGFVGTVVADASAAATQAQIVFGKF